MVKFQPFFLQIFVNPTFLTSPSGNPTTHILHCLMSHSSLMLCPFLKNYFFLCVTPCIVPITKSSSSLIYSSAVSINLMLIHSVYFSSYTCSFHLQKFNLVLFYVFRISNIFYLWSTVRITVLMSLLANSNSGPVSID